MEIADEIRYISLEFLDIVAIAHFIIRQAKKYDIDDSDSSTYDSCPLLVGIDV